MRYKVKCTAPPDSEGRRNCVECKKDPCNDPDCGVGFVYVGETPPSIARGKNKEAKRRQHKKGDKEETPRRRKGKDEEEWVA